MVEDEGKLLRLELEELRTKRLPSLAEALSTADSSKRARAEAAYDLAAERLAYLETLLGRTI